MVLIATAYNRPINQCNTIYPGFNTIQTSQCRQPAHRVSQHATNVKRKVNNEFVAKTWNDANGSTYDWHDKHDEDFDGYQKASKLQPFAFHDYPAGDLTIQEIDMLHYILS
ncbi:unnamed protein product [Albugo candida]|uniref:Uncharacterized protein n=1 Tax=Albugo candida TaxID=65357 RepID=A0A024GD01_9STRA|nr:unnamed protein product [Albugo candida]|eukprot:CCI44562.1 unnamed protein product [Albugo candida]